MCLQKLMLCLIILTFKHEISVSLVLKCRHDLQEEKKNLQKKYKELPKNMYESRNKKSKIFVE